MAGSQPLHTPVLPYGLRSQRHKGDEHFLHGDAAVLEGILIILHIMVVIIRIGKEAGTRGKDVGGRKVRLRELKGSRMANFIDLLGIVGKILSHLVAQVGVDIAVTYDL